MLKNRFSKSRRTSQHNSGEESQGRASASQSHASSTPSQAGSLSLSGASQPQRLQVSQPPLNIAEASQHASPTPQTPGSASSAASVANKRRGRGPSRANIVRVLPPGQTFPVDLVGGSAVGPHAQYFTTYLGVCNRVHCNLWQQDYTTLPSEKKEDIMRDLQKHFTFERSTATDADILRHMGDMQRKQRAHMKKKYYAGRSFQEACANLPLGYDSDQWRHMCEIWDREDNKRVSQRNKSNRSHLAMTYRRGRTNIHQLESDFLQKEGRPPTRPEIFQMSQTHPQSDGTIMWSNEQSRQLMDQMTQLMAPPPSDEADVDVPPALSPEEAFLQVFGRDRPGRIRCGGRGQTRKTWYGASEGSSSGSVYQHLMEKQDQQQCVIEKMQKIIEEQQQKLAEQQQKLAAQDKDVDTRVEERVAAMKTQMLEEMDQRMQEMFAAKMNKHKRKTTSSEDEDESDERDRDSGDEDEEDFGEDE